MKRLNIIHAHKNALPKSTTPPRQLCCCSSHLRREQATESHHSHIKCSGTQWVLSVLAFDASFTRVAVQPRWQVSGDCWIGWGWIHYVIVGTPSQQNHPLPDLRSASNTTVSFSSSSKMMHSAPTKPSEDSQQCLSKLSTKQTWYTRAKYNTEKTPQAKL